MGQTIFDEFHETIIETIEPKRKKKSVKAIDDDKGDNAVSNSGDADSSDAATAMEARSLADELHTKRNRPQKKKPRTYCEIARKAYLSLVKLRRPSNKKRRAGIRQQLQFLQRNLKPIETMLTEYPLCKQAIGTPTKDYT